MGGHTGEHKTRHLQRRADPHEAFGDYGNRDRRGAGNSDHHGQIVRRIHLAYTLVVAVICLGEGQDRGKVLAAS